MLTPHNRLQHPRNMFLRAAGSHRHIKHFSGPMGGFGSWLVDLGLERFYFRQVRELPTYSTLTTSYKPAASSRAAWSFSFLNDFVRLTGGYFFSTNSSCVNFMIKPKTSFFIPYVLNLGGHTKTRYLTARNIFALHYLTWHLLRISRRPARKTLTADHVCLVKRFSFLFFHDSLLVLAVTS